VSAQAAGGGGRSVTRTFVDRYGLALLAVLLLLALAFPTSLGRFFGMIEALLPFIVLWLLYRVARLEQRLHDLEETGPGETRNG